MAGRKKILEKIYSGHYIFISLSLIYLAGIGAYFNSFSGEFVFDDFRSIITQNALKNPGSLLNLWNVNRARFFPYLSFVLNYRLNGLTPLGYHIVNFLIHTATAFLVFFLVNILISTPRLRKTGLYKNKFFPFLSAFLFVIHPIQTQAVNFISQRPTLIAAFFYLLTLIFYFLYRGSKQKKKRVVYYSASIITFVMALFSKENSFSLALTIAVSDLIFYQKRTKKDIKRLVNLFPYFLITAGVFYIVYLRGVNNPIGRVVSLNMLYGEKITRWEYLLTQINVIRSYIGLLILPLRQTVDYDFPISKTLFEPGTLITFIFLIFIIGWTLSQLKKRPIVSFGLIFFFIALSIESSVIPLKDVIFEHRVYLPAIGFLITEAAIIVEIVHFIRKKFRNILFYFYFFFSLAMLFLFFLTIRRNFVWRSEYNLWQDAVNKAPGKDRAHYNLAVASYSIGKINKAKNEFIKTIEINPGYIDAYRNLGFIYESERENTGAEKLYQDGIASNPGNGLYLGLLASFFARTGNISRSIGIYEEILKNNPDNAFILNDAGLVYFLDNREKAAVESFEKALILNPSYETARLNLANTYFHFGKYSQAETNYHKVLELNPHNMPALFNLAQIAYQNGDLKGAREFLKTILSQEPDFPGALTLLTEINKDN